MEKEDWINNILTSLDNGSELELPVDLFDKINSRIKKSETSVIPLRWVFAAAASILLLISINLKVILNDNNSGLKTTSSLSENIYDQTNQLY